MTLESSALNTPWVLTGITLPDDVKRIDIAVSVRKQPTFHRKAAYIAFPFQVTHPSFAYDTQNEWVDPQKDEVTGGSHEWYATQHWAAVHGVEESVAVICLDAPIVTFGDIVRGAWPAEFSPKSPTIFSWLMSNYWSTNFIASQGGETTFRYVIVSSPQFDPVELTRLGYEQMTPLESDTVAASATPSAVFEDSFLKLDNKDIAITTWKRAEDNDGSILRLVEIAGRPETLALQTPHLQLRSARRCSLLEDCTELLEVEGGQLKVSLRPFEILTLKLETEPMTP